MINDPTNDQAFDESGLQVTLLTDLLLKISQYGKKRVESRYPKYFLMVLEAPHANANRLEPKTVESDVRIAQPNTEYKGKRKIIALTKSDRNVFQSKITVGRAKNNDIVIRASKISKLHCAFLGLEGEKPSIMDMGSSNGTWVNGVRLEKNETVPILAGDRLRFWRFVFGFTSLDSLLSSPEES